MATITSVLRSYGVYENRLIDIQASPLKIGIVSVAFGASESYATGGIAVANGIKSALGLKTIISASTVWQDLAGYVFHFNASTGKLQVFGQEPTNSTTGVIPLSELANGSSAINGKTVKLLVIGL